MFPPKDPKNGWLFGVIAGLAAASSNRTLVLWVLRILFLSWLTPISVLFWFVGGPHLLTCVVVYGALTAVMPPAGGDA